MRFVFCVRANVQCSTAVLAAEFIPRALRPELGGEMEAGLGVERPGHAPVSPVRIRNATP